MMRSFPILRSFDTRSALTQRESERDTPSSDGRTPRNSVAMTGFSCQHGHSLTPLLENISQVPDEGWSVTSTNAPNHGKMRKTRACCQIHSCQLHKCSLKSANFVPFFRSSFLFWFCFAFTFLHLSGTFAENAVRLDR